MKRNTHLEHPEDLLIQNGLIGAKHIIHIFQLIIDWFYGEKSHANITIKYDGAPAVVFGTHPTIDEEIFVSTKSFFNKTPLLAANKEEIMKHFNKDGTGPYKPLLALLHALRTSDAHQVGIFQGDILYTPETLVESKTHYEVKHNTLTYKIDKQSDYGKQIAKCSIGLVVHTEYDTISPNTYDASFEPQFEKVLKMYNKPTIWHPPLQPFATTSIREHAEIDSIMESVKLLIKQSKRLPDVHQMIEDTFTNSKLWFETLQKVINKFVRETKNLPTPEAIWKAWKDAMTTIYTSKKSFNADAIDNPCNLIHTFEKKHVRKVVRWLQWYINTASCKDSMVELLHSLVYHPGLEVYIDDRQTTHEGFVVSNMTEQWVIKLVKRSEFSHANFTIEKPWEKKKVPQKK